MVRRSQSDFYHADWNIQLVRSRSRFLETTLYAYDALVYQNYDIEVKARASPLDYVFQQLEYMLENWEALLLTSSNFLTSFVGRALGCLDVECRLITIWLNSA